MGERLKYVLIFKKFTINVKKGIIIINFYSKLCTLKYICASHLEMVVSELNHSILGLGLDTLEEQEEKEQFFARLEKGLTSSIDYSRLNKELDSNDSIHFKALRRSCKFNIN